MELYYLVLLFIAVDAVIVGAWVFRIMWMKLKTTTPSGAGRK